MEAWPACTSTGATRGKRRAQPLNSAIPAFLPPFVPRSGVTVARHGSYTRPRGTLQQSATIDLDNSRQYPDAMRGRPRSSDHTFVNNCHAITLEALKGPKHENGSCAEATGTWSDGKPLYFRIGLATTRPHFGGSRYWYVCPGCARRVAKLYCFEEDRQIRCRRCRGLVYETQYRKGRRWAFFRTYRRLIRHHRRFLVSGS